MPHIRSLLFGHMQWPLTISNLKKEKERDRAQKKRRGRPGDFYTKRFVQPKQEKKGGILQKQFLIWMLGWRRYGHFGGVRNGVDGQTTSAKRAHTHNTMSNRKSCVSSPDVREKTKMAIFQQLIHRSRRQMTSRRAAVYLVARERKKFQAVVVISTQTFDLFFLLFFFKYFICYWLDLNLKKCRLFSRKQTTKLAQMRA